MTKGSDSRRWAAWVWVSTALCIASFACFGLRPDAFAAVTVWPAWLYAVPAVILLIIARRAKCPRNVLLVTCGLWIVFLLAFCEEPRSLVYVPIRNYFTSSAGAQRLRVISLNCDAGSMAAAEEVIPYHPDIVLLQESPSRAEVESLARRLFGVRGGCAWGVDGSVLFRGRAKAVPLSSRLALNATQARVEMRGARQISVFSIRLTPPIARFDVLSPSYWEAQAELRRIHRKELRMVARQMGQLAQGDLAVVGGDFNAPAGDGATRELEPRLRDAFREGGVGWGNTVLNGSPLQRFDQIWVSTGLHVLSVRAYRTENSDHRLVVCDLAVPGRAGNRGEGKLP